MAALLFLAFVLWPALSHGLSSTPRVAPLAFVQRSASALEAHVEPVGDDGAIDSASTAESSPPPNVFEKTVRSVTRNKNYRFGDLSKKVV